MKGKNRPVPFSKCRRTLPCNNLLLLESVVIILNATRITIILWVCTGWAACPAHYAVQNQQVFAHIELKCVVSRTSQILVIPIYLQNTYYHFLSTPQASLSLKTMVVSIEVSARSYGSTAERFWCGKFFFSRIPNNISVSRAEPYPHVLLRLISLQSAIYLPNYILHRLIFFFF